MISEEKKVRYPENIYLKGLVAVSGRTIKELASKIGVSRHCLNLTVNGHYKGSNVVPALKKELGVDQQPA
jgi:DNA-binding XRE family transcriptional regulator